jgi:predicted TIM-barrel fold metal-dependent hydrolase
VFGPFDRFPLAAERAYTPGPASVRQLSAHLHGLGLERVVLVQPSPYAVDNSLLVHALAELGPAARAVAVLAPATRPDELLELHRAGVRGIRVNLHSNRVGRQPGSERIRASAEVAAPHGWHVQVFADAATLLDEAQLLADLPVPVVIDHFGLLPDTGRQLEGMLELLAQPNVWIKLSAPERSFADLADPRLAEVATALLAAAPRRTLWASDWPHTDSRNRNDPLAIEPFRPIDDRAALDRLWQWCADDELWQAVLSDNPGRLYGW